jgi:hypothetical protein
MTTEGDGRGWDGQGWAYTRWPWSGFGYTESHYDPDIAWKGSPDASRVPEDLKGEDGFLL